MAKNMNKAKANNSVKNDTEKVVTVNQNEVVNVNNMPEQVAPVVTAPVIKKKKFEQTEEVMCRSIVPGVLVMEGIQSHNFYKWAATNDVQGVEYRDLVSAVRSNTTYINSPHFIIEDEDFLKEFPKVQKVYDAMYSTKDLKDILNLSASSMIAQIDRLPDGSKNTLKDIAGKMVLNGQLDSVQKIKALDEYYNTNFMVTTNLY